MANDIKIRSYQDDDILAVIDLFKNAVHAINIKHYTQEQIAVWTDVNTERWRNSLAKKHCIHSRARWHYCWHCRYVA